MCRAETSTYVNAPHLGSGRGDEADLAAHPLDPRRLRRPHGCLLGPGRLFLFGALLQVENTRRFVVWFDVFGLVVVGLVQQLVE